MASPISKHDEINIRSEYSAQRRSQTPNPALQIALDSIAKLKGAGRLGRVADLGCGKLRHYAQLAAVSTELFLVDTPDQLAAKHTDQGEEYTIASVARAARARSRKVHVTAFHEFATYRLGLDLIACVAVLDVVPSRERKALITAAAQNLAHTGLFVIIAPRNDSTILRRCTPNNIYDDGHVFPHHGVHTFFHNFRDHKAIVKMCSREKLSVIEDLSTYRQVCLIFGRHPLATVERTG